MTVASKTEGIPSQKCQKTYLSVLRKESGNTTFSFRLSIKGNYWCLWWTPRNYFSTKPVIDVKELLGILIVQLHDSQNTFLILYVHKFKD